MSNPGEAQAILTPLTEAAIFLVLTVDSAADDATRALLVDVSGLRRSVGFRNPEAGLTCLVGLGSELWDRLFGTPRPAALHPFPGFAGTRHAAIATPGDLLFHIRAARLDLCFELAQRLMDRLDGSARVIDEVHGFRSFDERDLLGFVDGTENPEGEAARTAVVVGDEDPLFAGFVADTETPRAVVGLTISGGRIGAIDLITDPDKLTHLKRNS